MDRVAYDRCSGYGHVGPLGDSDYLADEESFAWAFSEDCVVEGYVVADVYVCVVGRLFRSLSVVFECVVDDYVVCAHGWLA